MSSDEFRAHLRPTGDLPQRRASRREVIVEGVDEELRPLVDAAVADLMARLGSPAAGVAPAGSTGITVEAAAAVTWSDTSCGCPEPGRAYPQVPIDGTYVRLAVGGRVFHYHAGGGRAVFLCDS